jgi:hypothetical protein
MNRKIFTLILALAVFLGSGLNAQTRDAARKSKTQSTEEIKTGTKDSRFTSGLTCDIDRSTRRATDAFRQTVQNRTSKSGAKGLLSYGWNAYGGTVAVGPVTIEVPEGTLTSIASSADNFVTGADFVEDVWYGVKYADGVPSPLGIVNK